MPHPGQTLTEKIARDGVERAAFSTTNRQTPALVRFFGNVPGRLWARLLMLAGGLAGIKVALLYSLRKELFETHWRVSGVPASWVDYLAFYLFVAIGVLSVVLLAQHCRRVGVRATRAANGAVLFLGLLFIFLTFHSGENNYIYPVMTGLLKWSSLAPYLSLDLFFRAPFLALWIAAYAAVYYLMARTGREGWALYLTAVVAAAFALLYLRELVYFRNELLVADCFGLACLMVAGLRGATSFRVRWLLLPLAWTILYLALLRSISAELAQANPYFLLLAGESAVLFGAATLWAKRGGFLEGWVPPLLFYCAGFFLVANANYPFALNYDQLVCLAVEVPRYFIGETGLVLAFAFVGAIYLRLRPSGGLWWLDIISLLLIVIAVIDLRLCQITGVRLGWDVLSFGDSPKMMWRLAKPFLPGIAIGLGALALVYSLGIRLLKSWLSRASNLGVRGPASGSIPGPFRIGPGLWFVAVSSALLAILGSLAAEPDKAEGESALRFASSCPLLERSTGRPLSAVEFRKMATELGLGTLQPQERTTSSLPPQDLNVVLIFMESSYNKHLSLFGSDEQTQPLLSRYKERMELFPNFFSAFAGSIHARFATFTSLYPVRDFNEFTSRRVEVKSLFEVLHDEGYACSLFYSSFFTYTGFGDFLKNRGLDQIYDAESMPGQRFTEPVSWGLREEETLAAMREQIKKYSSDGKRFFLTYVPATPHFPYDDIPKRFRQNKVKRVGDCTPFYLNGLLYMDWIMDSMLEELKANGLLVKTLVIITNDHGEMLGGGEGPIGHGWAVTPELVNTPLIIMDPRKPGTHVNYRVGSQVDLLPTVLDRLNVPIPRDQLYEGHSLDSAQPRTGLVAYLNSYRQYALLSGDRLFLGDRESESGGADRLGRSAYQITNDGTKTLFKPESASTPTTAIRDFDDFQSNFLRNYSFYCQTFSRDGMPVSTASKSAVSQRADAR